MNAIIFKVIGYGTCEYKDAVTLREKILRRPLGLKFTPEELEKERDYIHFIGLIDNEIIATASLVPEQSTCKMRQVAVSEDMQNLGVGSKLVNFCEMYAKTQGWKSIHCHARNYAVRFYTKKGYISEGDYFKEVNIPHLKMTKVF